MKMVSNCGMLVQLPGLDPQSILRKLSSIVDQNGLQVSLHTDSHPLFSFPNLEVSFPFSSLASPVQDPDLVRKSIMHESDLLL